MDIHLHQARRIAEIVIQMPNVIGVTLGGSVAWGLADAQSDLDLHVYHSGPLPPDAERRTLLSRIESAIITEIGNNFWGLEDHLMVEERLAELIYVDWQSLQVDLQRAWADGLDGEGFVTALIASLAHGIMLADPTGQLAAARERLATYPEPTRQRVLVSNPFYLRSYLALLRKAQARGDLLSAQQRRYTIQMVFFNLLFALNRVYHPGEKRLLEHAERLLLKPANHTQRWRHIARLPADDFMLVAMLEDLVDELCTLAETVP